GDLDGCKDRGAVGGLGAIAGDANLADALRLDLDGELRRRGRELGVERGDLAIEGIKVLDHFRLDADLRKLRIDLPQLLGGVLHRLELPGEIVLALRTDGRRDKLLQLLLAPRQSLQRPFYSDGLLLRAGDRGAGLLFAANKLRKV